MVTLRQVAIDPARFFQRVREVTAATAPISKPRRDSTKTETPAGSGATAPAEGGRKEDTKDETDKGIKP